jgi:hypothetical protein
MNGKSDDQSDTATTEPTETEPTAIELTETEPTEAEPTDTEPTETGTYISTGEEGALSVAGDLISAKRVCAESKSFNDNMLLHKNMTFQLL